MIGERIKKERKRLGFTQPALGDLVGAQKGTVINWEKGVSSPTALQLSVMAEAGVDVSYILTGHRIDGAVRQNLDQILRTTAEIEGDQPGELSRLAVETASKMARSALEEKVIVGLASLSFESLETIQRLVEALYLLDTTKDQ